MPNKEAPSLAPDLYFPDIQLLQIIFREARQAGRREQERSIIMVRTMPRAQAGKRHGIIHVLKPSDFQLLTVLLRLLANENSKVRQEN